MSLKSTVPSARPITPDELRDKLLRHMKQLARYWATVEGNKSTLDRIEGALFSTLAMLDGSTMDIVAFDLVARPHKDDKQWHIDRNENWVEDGTVISDCLHEYWHSI